MSFTAFVGITFFALLANVRCHQSRRQLADSSSDENELTDSETDYRSDSETELTDVDDDVEEVIKDFEGPIDCADLLLMITHLNISSNRRKSLTSLRTTAMALPFCLIGSKNSGVSK